MGVYTRTGDGGETGLVGGTRVSKADTRLELYGNVDELNSFLGLAISHLEKSSNSQFLLDTQSRLFDLGSNLACESDKRAQFKLPEINSTWAKDLEIEIDRLNESLPELKNFILPGGSQASSALHICRTICRRLERQMIAFQIVNPEELPQDAVPYINRLSDYFFMVARAVNDKDEVIWSAATS
jgi:cob(I)alamin adenosyltransferase